MKLYYILRNALTMFWFAIWHPKIVQKDTFQTLSQLLLQITTVAYEKRPMTSKLAIMDVETGNHTEILTIWIGFGASSSPMVRNAELVSEVDALKETIDNLNNQS